MELGRELNKPGGTVRWWSEDAAAGHLLIGTIRRRCIDPLVQIKTTQQHTEQHTQDCTISECDCESICPSKDYGGKTSLSGILTSLIQVIHCQQLFAIIYKDFSYKSAKL